MEGEVADTQLSGHLPFEMRSATEHHTAIVVGGGQSGLATSYYLRRFKVDFLVLDNQEEPGGAWLHTWPSLTLFSAAEFSNLPGWPMPRYPGYPPASHVIDYLESYEKRYDLPVRRPVHVRSVSHEGGTFTLDSTAGQFTAEHVVAATGTLSLPQARGPRPSYPTIPAPSADASGIRRPTLVPNHSAMRKLRWSVGRTRVLRSPRTSSGRRRSHGSHVSNRAGCLMMSMVAISFSAAAAGFSVAMPTRTSGTLSHCLIYVSSATPVSSPLPPSSIA